MLKKLLSIIITLAIISIPTIPVGSSTETFIGPPESQFRLIEGNYFDCGLIFTDDGEIWEYDDPTESIPQNTRVIVCFDINETDSNLNDDKVIKMLPLEFQDGTMYWEHF